MMAVKDNMFNVYKDNLDGAKILKVTMNYSRQLFFTHEL